MANLVNSLKIISYFLFIYFFMVSAYANYSELTVRVKNNSSESGSFSVNVYVGQQPSDMCWAGLPGSSSRECFIPINYSSSAWGSALAEYLEGSHGGFWFKFLCPFNGSLVEQGDIIISKSSSNKSVTVHWGLEAPGCSRWHWQKLQAVDDKENMITITQDIEGDCSKLENGQCSKTAVITLH